MMTEFSGITKDIFALPRRGVTKSTASFGGTKVHQWTYLCEVDGCFALAYSQVSEEAARAQVRDHACPAPPRRGLIPQGKSLLEQMWDEADDAMDAFKAGVILVRDTDLLGKELAAYLRGVAECISMCSTPYWRVAEDVLRQLNKRWRMRQGEIPFSPTPGYRFNPMPSAYEPPERVKHPSPYPATRTPSTRTRAPLAKKAPAEPLTSSRTFSDGERTMIANALSAGTLSAQSLAVMFGVSESRIMAVAGPSVPLAPLVFMEMAVIKPQSSIDKPTS